MIINSILSLAFLWSIRKCLIHVRYLGKLRNKMMKSSVIPVSEAIKKMGEIPVGRKVFMVIRGKNSKTKV